jgi:hypothetical protein
MIKEKPPQNTGFSPTPSKIVNGNVSFLKIWRVHYLPDVSFGAPPVPKIILMAILGLFSSLTPLSIGVILLPRNHRD